jgi:chemotaxis protein methyltransferase CheR
LHNQNNESVIRPDLSLREFELFRRFIREQSGIDLNENQIDSLRISLSARTRKKHLRDYLDYYELLRQDPQGEEFKELLNLITVNETYFFRTPSHFAALREHVLPKIVTKKKENKLSIWSAGCSTGEEPYTIAIILKEYFGEAVQEWNIRILATDVSKQALTVAQEAAYGGRTLRLVDTEYLSRYFEAYDEERYRLRDEIRKMVSFGYQNLVKEPFPLEVMNNWDIIFCRNVIIYFNLDSAKRVINNFYECLNEGGYLFVGYAEMLQPICDRFTLLEFGKGFAYRKPAKDEALELAEGKAASFDPGLLAEPNIPDPKVAVSESEEEDLRRAEVYLEEEEFELAKPVLNRILEKNPRNVTALLLRAMVSANLSDYRQAEQDCLKATRINRMVAAAHFILGVVYDNQGKGERALVELRKTLYLDPDFALAYLKVGNIYRSQGRTNDALRELRNAAAAARRAPQGEWLKYAGGFMTEAIVETAERLAGRLEKTKTR